MNFIFIDYWLFQCTILWKSVESTPKYYWYRSLNLFYNISQVFIYTLFSYCDTKIKIEISWKCTTKMNILLCHHCQHPGMFSLIYWSSLNCCSSLFLAQVINCYTKSAWLASVQFTWTCSISWWKRQNIKHSCKKQV